MKGLLNSIHDNQRARSAHLVQRRPAFPLAQSIGLAGRVLRPTGILFGVVIPRWASTLIGMLRGWIFDNAYADMVRREITTGHHARPDTWPDLFVDGYF